MTRRPALLLTTLAAAALTACGGGGGGGDTDAGGGSAAAEGPPDAQTVTVIGTPGLEFEPARVTAEQGSLTLTLKTVEGPPHNLVFSDASLPPIETVAAGDEASQTYTFTAAGSYDFVCTLHPGMDGALVVS